MELMALLYEILQKARKEGMMSIEKDVEDPHSAPIFQKYTVVGSDHHLVEFITDYLRMMVSGNMNALEIESLMDSEIETHHHEAHAPVNALARLADGLPAFGIVAAVMGVVHTMGSVGLPPAVLGGMIGSALVGTFLGILLAYGFVGPLGGLLEQKVDEGSKELQCVKMTLLASMNGYAPPIAVEFGRKVLYSAERPTFTELEEHVEGQEAREPALDDMATGDPKKLQPIIIKRIKKGGHGAPRRRLEDRLCRLRDGDDGVLPADVAARLDHQGRPEGHRRYFNTPLKVALMGGSGSGDSSRVYAAAAPT